MNFILSVVFLIFQPFPFRRHNKTKKNKINKIDIDGATWWTKIVIGLLLLIFIVLQRFVQAGAGRRIS